MDENPKPPIIIMDEKQEPPIIKLEDPAPSITKGQDQTPLNIKPVEQNTFITKNKNQKAPIIIDGEPLPPGFNDFVLTATEPSASDSFKHPRLFRFPHHNEPVNFKRVLGSGVEGVVLEAVIGRKRYAVKLVRLTAQSDFLSLVAELFLLYLVQTLRCLGPALDDGKR